MMAMEQECNSGTPMINLLAHRMEKAVFRRKTIKVAPRHLSARGDPYPVLAPRVTAAVR